MFVILALLLNVACVASQDQCEVGSINHCHQAASCVNRNGHNTCICNDWYIGDGLNCVGFCNNSCPSQSCRPNAFGRSCLDSNSFTGLLSPSNIRVTWRSDSALTFTWDYVENAYQYVAILRQTNTRKKASTQYITIIPLAGFDGLSPNTNYTIEIHARNSHSEKSNKTTCTSTTLGRVLNARNQQIGLPGIDECRLGSHNCHPEATCKNTRNGYTCTCKTHFVGNGTQCVGVCGNKCSGDRRCVQTPFGYTCLCGQSSESRDCKAPRPPRKITVVQRTPTTLMFEWDLQPNTASYSAILRRRKAGSFVTVGAPYDTRFPRAAFTKLIPGTNYTVCVSSSNLITRSYECTRLSTSTEYACLHGSSHCHANATCSSMTGQCVCDVGFYGSGVDCSRVYAQDFLQRLKGNHVGDATVENTLLNAFRRKNRNIVNVVVTQISVKNVTYRVFFTDMKRDLISPNNAPMLLSEDSEPLKDACPTMTIANYTFLKAVRGNVQESTEKCLNGLPIASVNCTRRIRQIPGALLLTSQFSFDTLNITSCNDVTTTELQTTPSPATIPVIEKVLYNSSFVEVAIPPEAIEQALSQLNVSSGITPTIEVHENDDEFPSDYDIDFVITIDIGTNTTIENLTNPIQIVNVRENTTYGQVKKVGPLLNERVIQQCVFWDVEDKRWSREGCCLNNNLFPPTCECNHLSSFALIVSTVEVPANLVLSIVSDVGCWLSIVGLFATFLTLFLNGEARKKIPNQILLHFTFNLFVTYTIFVFGVSRVEHSTVCTIIAGVLHYFFLVSWMWIAIYSNRLYVALIQVFKQTGNHFVRKASVFAYGVPLIIVAIDLALTVGYFDTLQTNDELCNPDDVITKTSHYRAEHMCWLRSHSLYYGFLTIVGIILLNNIVVLALVIKKICSRDSIRSTRVKRSKYSELISAVSLSFTLGITWLFGFLMLISTDSTYNLVMNWLFAVFNASQGFVIWYVTCVKRNDMRKFWWHPIKNVLLRLFNKMGCYEFKTKLNRDEDTSGTESRSHMITASSKSTAV